MRVSQSRSSRLSEGRSPRGRAEGPDETATTDRIDQTAHYPVQLLNRTITIRVSESEKVCIELFAERSDQSVGRYLVAAWRATGQMQLDDLLSVHHGDGRRAQSDQINRMLDDLRERGALDFARATRRRRKRHGKRPPIPKELKIPFLQREFAKPFERVVGKVARRMHASQFSVARLLSFFAEAVGEEVVNGSVFRFPGFFVVGPWLPPEGKGPGGCLPRFQAAPPFETLVQWTCPEDAAQNRSLQAHRRRSRKRPSLLPQAMEAFRARIEAQDRAYLDSIEEWRAYGP